jgi:hypothetical protein
MKARASARLVPGLILLLLAACSGPERPGTGDGLSGMPDGGQGMCHPECPEDKVCTAGTCAPLPAACPCPRESYCDIGGNTCKAGCLEDVHCGGGRICVSATRTCVAGCRKDDDCVGADQYCDLSSARCRAPMGSGVFNLGTAISVPSAIWVSAGDFNKDGKADLAVASLSKNSVTVLLGRGDGTFPISNTFAVGGAPNHLVIGDFNGDDRLDLVSSNLGRGVGDAGLTVLAGRGDGTFAAASSPPLGRQAFQSVAADLNGDGKLDLVTAFYRDPGVAVLLGRGDGTFQASTIYPAGQEVTAVDVGDLNLDGKLDLAVSDALDLNIGLLLGRGDGTFNARSPVAAGNTSSDVKIADFNVDGRPDIVTTSPLGGGVILLLSRGADEYAARRFATPAAPRRLIVGHFNADRRLDVLTDSGTAVNVLLGDGTGGLGAATGVMGVPTGPPSMAAGDWDGDGKLDVAIVRSDSVYMLINQ